MRTLATAATVLLLTGCVSGGDTPVPVPTADSEHPQRAPFASSYAAPEAAPLLVRGATVLTGTGHRLEGTDVLVVAGRIAAVGSGLDAPQAATLVDGRGKWLTPGLIDVHSHLGNYPSPGVRAHSDGNESVNPNTAGVWAEHGVWPQDPQFPLALAGGVTALQVLPGSANLFGGRGVVLKNVPASTVMDMKFPGAPHSLKMACGENPKRTYGRNMKRRPRTRMGNVRGYRQAFIDAADYREERRQDADKKRNLRNDTLVGVLDGEILVHNHCYRADEMAVMLDVAREAGYRITAFHHAVEAYKIADLLARHNVCVATWADWWGTKLEQYDSVRANVALVDAAGGCAIVHSDSGRDIQRLNQEAAKAMAAGREIGLDLDEAHAIRWITANPAQALGILDQTGTIEPGKMADLTLWNGNPFSVYSLAERVWVDGVQRYHRGVQRPLTDFDVGHTVEGRQ